MRTILSTILLLALSALMGYARDVTFEWNASPESDVTEYRLYQKVTTSAVPPATAPTITWKVIGVVAAPKTRFTVANIPVGTSTYRVTAFNSSKLESDPSNELGIPMPAAPTELRFTVQGTVTVVIPP